MLIHEGAVARHTSASSYAASHSTGDARRLIFVTNRGPVEYAFTSEGIARPHRGAGGVVSGLLCAARERPVSWISMAMTDADRAVARALDGNTLDRAALPMRADMANLSPRLVNISKATYAQYYNGISNRLLWFAQHGMLSREVGHSAEMRAAWTGYVAANNALAQAVVAELEHYGETTPVLFHDYHLYLAPAMVRERVPQARLQHFIHIPWPSLEEWGEVPEDMLRAIYRSLSAVDVLGFQTPRDARNFLAGAGRFLPGARVSRDPDELLWHDRRTLVRAYPIAVTPASVRASADTPAARTQARALRRQLRLDAGRKLIVRVDRVEPTKNIVRGFEAYERLLEEQPHWRERVTFLALLVPSRESVAEYQDYAEQVREAIERVNARFGTADWEPIVAIFGNDRARALACMRDYDVLLVNSVADGMNLVVKEGGLLNERNGVIVLSERAGAYAQLHRGALGIAPTDVAGTSQALLAALEMSDDERAARGRRVRDVLEREDANTWLARQLADLMRVTSGFASGDVALDVPGIRYDVHHMGTWALSQREAHVAPTDTRAITLRPVRETMRLPRATTPLEETSVLPDADVDRADTDEGR